MEGEMRTATIQIRKDDAEVLREAGSAFIHAWNAGTPEGDLFTFASPAQLFSVLTPRRWELIERLQAIGPSSLRGLARELGRDVKRVHEDVAILLEWGLVERTAERKLIVPFAVIHADFDLRAAA
jgi:predicted transcriptional regulator